MGRRDRGMDFVTQVFADRQLLEAGLLSKGIYIYGQENASIRELSSPKGAE